MKGIIFPYMDKFFNEAGVMLDAASQLGGGSEGSQQETEAAAASTETAAPDGSEAEAAPRGGLMDFAPMLLLWGGVFIAIYFFLFRPQRKREKSMAAMQDSLKVGDNIVTTGGLYGKIAELGQEAHIVEFGTNRGVRVAVRKNDIAGIKTPVLTPPHTKGIAEDKPEAKEEKDK